MDEIVNILPDQENYVIQTKLPSYVRIFLSEIPENAVFIHKISVPEVQKTEALEESSVNSPFDVSGSPLKFSIYSLQCEDTVTTVKYPWASDEENQASVSLEEARRMITKLLLFMKNCDQTVWITCDGSDYKNTVLLSGCKKNGWCTRSVVMYKGKINESLLQAKLDAYLRTENLIRYNIFCVKNLFESDDTERSVRGSVELVWHRPLVSVPKEGVQATLVVEGSAGSEYSQAHTLWRHLCLLCQCLNSLREAKSAGCAPVMPLLLKKSSKHEWPQILKFIESKGREMNRECPPLTEDIFDLVQQVTKSRRPGSDITDKIWLLLAESEDIKQMADILNRILKAVRKHELKPHVSLTNCTFLAKTLTAIRRDIAIVVEVSATEALRIMIETGIEKLRQDYSYIFKNLNMDPFLEFSNLVTDDCFDTASQNLNVMAQLQASLDVLLVAQAHLNLSPPALCSFAQDLFIKCSSEVSLEETVSRSPFTIKIPTNFDNVVDCLPMSFVSYRLTTSSTAKGFKDTTVLLFTSSPIFPPSVFKFNEDTEEEKEEDGIQKGQYFSYQLSSWSDHFNS